MFSRSRTRPELASLNDEPVAHKAVETTAAVQHHCHCQVGITRIERGLFLCGPFAPVESFLTHWIVIGSVFGPIWTGTCRQPTMQAQTHKGARCPLSSGTFAQSARCCTRDAQLGARRRRLVAFKQDHPSNWRGTVCVSVWPCLINDHVRIDYCRQSLWQGIQ